MLPKTRGPTQFAQHHFLTLAIIVLLLLFTGPCAVAQEPQQITATEVTLPDPQLEQRVLSLHLRSRFDALRPEVFPPLAPVKVVKPLKGKYDLDKIGNRGIGKGVNLFSLESERKAGAQMAQEYAKVAKLIADPVVTEYINRITQNMGLQSDVKVPLTVRIIDQDEVNAFSLPGGYLFISTGLLREADSEAEVVGVMAHEVAHVAARHATREMSKVLLWAIALSAAAASAPGRWGQVGAQVGAIVGTELVLSKLSRGAEDEADLLAIEYLYAAGYDPHEYVQLFERVQALEKKKPSAIGKLFASHPTTESRIIHVQKVIDDSFPPKQAYMITTSSFHDVQERLLSILGGRKPDPDQQPEGPVLRKAPAEGEKTQDPKQEK